MRSHIATGLIIKCLELIWIIAILSSMYIKRLKLTNFRNINEAEFEFSPDKNLISGPNGTGKTNILEALFYVGAARSFRTHLDEHLVNRDSDFFRLEAEGSIGPHDITVEIGVKPGQQKNIKINSAPLKRLGDLYEYFRLVEFSPYDMSLITGSPSIRRRYLSLTVSQSDARHISVLSEYQKTLAQRNALLKNFQDQHRLSPDQEASLSVWDEKLAASAVLIKQKRSQYINEISKLSKDYYQKIVGNDETLQLEYIPSPNLTEYTAEAFCQKLSQRRARELALSQTMYGPHRDDLKFVINGLEAKSGGSQGQIKTAVLSLKLAHYEYLRQLLEETPILLLDEIFSDLDQNRLDFILKLLPQLGQTFITTAKPSEINDLSIFNSKFNFDSGIWQ